MAKESQHKVKFKCAAVIAALLCIFSAEVFAQNTKGDKPAKTERSVFRMPKIKTKSKHGDKAYRGDISGRRRIRTRDKSSAAHITQNPTSNYNTRQPSRGDRAYQAPPGSNKRIRSSSAQMARNNIYPSNWAYTDIPKKKKSGDHSVFSASATMSYRKKRTAQAARRIARSSGGALSPSTSPYDFRKKRNGDRASKSSGGFWSSANAGRVNPDRYMSNPSPFPRKGQRVASGRNANRSASRSYVTWGRKNVYWGKFKVKERPITTDITGRPLRSADFHSLPLPSGEAKARRKALGGDKVGGFLGRIFSGSPNAKDRSWLGNISGNSLRRSTPHDNQNVGSSFWSVGNSVTKRFKGTGGGRRLSATEPNPTPGDTFWSGGLSRSGRSRIYGFRGKGSASGGWNNSGRAISGRTPASGWTVGTFQGNIKTRKPIKGGGSIKHLWNNGEQPLTGRTPSGGWIMGTYQGNIKTRRPLKGGGSIKQLWNNSEQPLTGRSPSSDWVVGTYQGNIKTRRPLKGGGSIKQLWNNGEQPLTGRSPSSGWVVETYQGNIKTKRPLKGGGSIKQLWNNGEQPLTGRSPSSGWIVGTYQGNIKTRKPYKGGGSIRQQWNNDEQPILGTAPTSGFRMGIYQGNIKTGKPVKGGGSIKRLWNNNEQPTTLNNFGDAGYSFTGKIRSWGPEPKGGGSIKQSWNNKEKPLNGKYFIPVSISTIEYSNKLQAYWRAKVKKENLSGHVPMKKYAHTPHGVKEALMVLSPTPTTMRVNDYQVSVKMFKPQGKNLHPDAQFAHSLRDNVKEERTFMMNLKLTWARLFKKNENQTKAVKEKVHKPRYDPKERDLWKDLYD